MEEENKCPNEPHKMFTVENAISAVSQADRLDYLEQRFEYLRLGYEKAGILIMTEEDLIFE